MHVIYINGEIVYASTDLNRFRKEVSKKYASVVNARIGFIKPSYHKED